MERSVAPGSRWACGSRAERGASRCERVTKLAHCRSDFGGGAKDSGRSSACSFKVRKNRSQTPFASGWCGKA